MTDKQTQAQADQSNMEKPPEKWVTGDEPMTGAQRSYLHTLSEEAKEELDENLTKAEASMRIDELQAKTGRGTHSPQQGGQQPREKPQSDPPQQQGELPEVEEAVQESRYTGA